MKDLTIVNVVATANLHQKIDLAMLSRVGLAIHDEAVYGGRVAYFKTEEMKGKISIFASGKMISVGTKNKEDALGDLEKVRDALVNAKIIHPISIETKIQNTVATLNLRKKLELEDLSVMQGMVFEPEQFPGGVLKLDKPHKSTVLVFSSGRLIITGLKNEHQIEQTARYLKEILGS